MGGVITLLLQNAFMAWCLIKQGISPRLHGAMLNYRDNIPLPSPSEN